MERKTRIITEREVDIFRKSLICSEKSSNTVTKYIRDILKFKNYANGKPVTKTRILAYKSALEKCGKYKASSINSFLAALNHFCRIMGWGELCVKTIKVQQMAFVAEEKELTIEEYRRLIQKALETGDEQTALILQTIGSTGIRIGELKSITVECLKDGAADIYNKGKLRHILLPSSLTRLLGEYVKKHEIPGGAVFTDRKKKPVSRKSVWRKMKRIARFAGVPESKVFPHNLRHLFAREFYRQTQDMMKLADVLGHSNINTTRIYIRTAGREHKRQLDAMKMVMPGISAEVLKKSRKHHRTGIPVMFS